MATGGSLVHMTLIVTIHGLSPSEPSQYASNARKLNVAGPQKSAAGMKSTVPSESKLVMDHWEPRGGSKSEYEMVPPELISVAVTTQVMESESSNPGKLAASVTGGVLLVTTSALSMVCPISFSRLSTNVVVPSDGGVTLIVQVDATI